MSESTGTSCNSKIFKALNPSMDQKVAEGGDSSNPPNSTRMAEALRLRQALQNPSSSRMSRKLLINELKSPKQGEQHQFEDTDEGDEYEDDDDFAVASFRGKNLGENDEPNVGTGRYSSRAAILARLEVKNPSSPASKKFEMSVSSKVFQDQLSARFKSTSKPAQKFSSVDSTEEKWGE